MSKQENYFQALSQLSRAMGETDDQDKMLNLIVETAVETLHTKAAVIFLTEYETEDTIVNTAVAQIGLSDHYIHAGPGHVIKISPQMLKDGYVYFRDATTDKRLLYRESKKKEGIGSILSVPVMAKGRMVGILSVYTKEIRTFTQDEIDFISILAEQGGTAIDNANLIRKLRELSQIFLKVATSISSSLDVKTILQAMTEDLVKNLQIKAAAVRLLDEETRTLKSVASFGLSDKYLNKGPVTAGKNIAGALRGKTIVIQDVSKDTGVQHKKDKIEEGIVSMLYVPIKSKDSIIGVLIAYSDRPKVFTDQEISVVSALASQGGLAIANACMYLSAQDDLKDLKENIWSHKCWF